MSIKKTVISIIAIVCLTIVANFALNFWPIPIQNEVAIKQLNGGNSEFIQMQNTFVMIYWSRVILASMSIISIFALCILLAFKNLKRRNVKNDVK